MGPISIFISRFLYIKIRSARIVDHTVATEKGDLEQSIQNVMLIDNLTRGTDLIDLLSGIKTEHFFK